MSIVLVGRKEFGTDISRLWETIIPADARLIGMTIFGDLILERADSVSLLRLSWFVMEEIGTVIDEVEWQLEAPSERGAHWVYPALVAQLPARPAGHIYHFVTPLGLGGHPLPTNVTLLPIEDAHRGMRSLWSQVADLPSGTRVRTRQNPI